MIVPLSRPIKAHGEERMTLELREPSAGDIAACGYPFSFSNLDSGATVTSPNAAAISAFISRLGAVPPSTVAQMSAADWNACMGVILGFFGGSEPEMNPSTDGSISAGSGNGHLAQS